MRACMRVRACVCVCVRAAASTYIRFPDIAKSLIHVHYKIAIEVSLAPVRVTSSVCLRMRGSRSNDIVR